MILPSVAWFWKGPLTRPPDLTTNATSTSVSDSRLPQPKFHVPTENTNTCLGPRRDSLSRQPNKSPQPAPHMSTETPTSSSRFFVGSPRKPCATTSVGTQPRKTPASDDPLTESEDLGRPVLCASMGGDFLWLAEDFLARLPNSYGTQRLTNSYFQATRSTSSEDPFILCRAQHATCRHGTHGYKKNGFFPLPLVEGTTGIAPSFTRP